MSKTEPIRCPSRSSATRPFHLRTTSNAGMRPPQQLVGAARTERHVASARRMLPGPWIARTVDFEVTDWIATIFDVKSSRRSGAIGTRSCTVGGSGFEGGHLGGQTLGLGVELAGVDRLGHQLAVAGGRLQNGARALAVGAAVAGGGV